jgi:hypothetical protein
MRKRSVLLFYPRFSKGEVLVRGVKVCVFFRGFWSVRR